MQTFLRLARLSLLFLAVPPLAAAAQSPPSDDQVLVEIGGRGYTVAEFLLHIRQINPRIRFWDLPASERQKHLDDFVQRKLWALEARRAGFDEDPETRARIDFFTDGVLATGYKARLQEQIEVSPEELESYYREHLDQFRTEPRYHLRHLLYSTPEEALAARERWLGGASFGELAGERGQGGGPILSEDKWFTPAILLPELQEAARGLEQGEISQGIYSSYGYHLLRLVELEPSRQLTLEESSARIEVQLRRAKSRELHRERLEQLREQFPVQVRVP